MKTIGNRLESSFIYQKNEVNKTQLKTTSNRGRTFGYAKRTYKPKVEEANDMKQLFNKYTTSKIASRLTAYDSSGFFIKSKVHKESIPRYTLSEKKSYQARVSIKKHNL